MELLIGELLILELVLFLQRHFVSHLPGSQMGSLIALRVFHETIVSGEMRTASSARAPQVI